MEIDFISSFYSVKYSEESLFKEIDSILAAEPNIKARLFPVFIDERLFSRIMKGDEGFKLIYSEENVKFFDYTFKVRQDDHERWINGKVFLIRNLDYRNVYAVLTIEDSEFFERGVLAYFRRKYPLAALTFISHKRLKNLLLKFRSNHKFTMFDIVRATTYSRIDEKVVPSLSWPEFSLERAFEWADEVNGWFQRLTIKVQKNKKSMSGKISVSRNGIVKVDRYSRAAYDDLILPISRVVNQNIEFFGRRSRRDNKEGNISPLCIDFGFDKFDSLEESKRFIQSMKKMKSSSISLIHGNPYVHMSVFDYYDGSSFDVWVLSEDKIIMVPQSKATFQSVKRIINHIFDNYAEGDIKNYEVPFQ